MHFDCDLTERYREDWENIVMDYDAQPTLQEYLTHVVHWQAAYRRVTGITAEEAARKFLASLPDCLNRVFSDEEARSTIGK